MCKKKTFIHARNCPHRNDKGPQDGYYYETKNNYMIIRECDCHVKYRKALELEAKRAAANIHPDYSFDDYRGTESIKDFKAFKYLAEHFKDYSYKHMFYLYGPNETMKTSMAICLGDRLLQDGFSVVYTDMANLINNLIVTFNDENKEKKEAFINRCMEADLLILDESFDKFKVNIFNTGYQLPFLDSFLRSKFEVGKKCILFISNVPPNNISQNGFGDSLQSLVERNVATSTFIFKDKFSRNAVELEHIALFGDKIQ